MRGCKAFNRSWGAGSPHVSLVFEDHTLELLVQNQPFSLMPPGSRLPSPTKKNDKCWWRWQGGTVQVKNCGVEVLQLGIHNFPGAGFHLPSITALAEDVIHWWLCRDLPGVHNGPCHSLTTQATLSFRSLHFTKSVVASQFCVQQKPRV